MTALQKRLLALADPSYAAFQARLNPTIPADSVIGVRVPLLRKLAADFAKSPECSLFLDTLPHTYYDENLLHSILLNKSKSFEQCLASVERFLPYVDNWAVCDTLKPNIFAKHTAELLPLIENWAASDHPYTCRFAIDMLMTFYLDEAFRPELAQIPAEVQNDDYYVKMMAAWYFATALAKQWNAIIPYLEDHRMPEWTHRKTIQKACESRRISPQQKEYLRSLK